MIGGTRGVAAVVATLDSCLHGVVPDLVLSYESLWVSLEPVKETAVCSASSILCNWGLCEGLDGCFHATARWFGGSPKDFKVTCEDATAHNLRYGLMFCR